MPARLEYLSWTGLFFSPESVLQDLGTAFFFLWYHRVFLSVGLKERLPPVVNYTSDF